MPCQITFGPRALPLGKHAQLSSHIRSVDLLLSRTVHFFELQEPRSLLSLRHVIMKLRRRSTRTFRILEDIKTVVLTLFDQCHRFVKVFVSFTRKADDD